jgi:SET domain-containing protein
MAHEYTTVKRSAIEGKGLFAKKNIPKGMKIIEYLGERITKAEGDRRSDAQEESGKPMVIFELNKRTDLDASVGGSGAEYANHSCDPNVESENIRGHIWLIALRDIKKGDEIVYDYNFDPDAEFTPCHCGAAKCRGSINRVKKKRKKSTKKKS